MTNLNRKTIIAAIAALLVTLTGCKDDDSFSTFIFETYSVDFEWGQTKEVSYSTNKISGFDAPTVSAGWTCVRKNGKVIITAPPQGSAVTSGKVSLKARGEKDATIVRTIDVAVRIAEPIDVRANSFIVSEPGKRFKFNARRRGAETTETINGATGGRRLWSTSKTAIVNVSYENGYIYFATGDEDVFEDANAVLAVTDKDGNALWSWHLWVTGYDPASEFDLYGGKTVMNRNLGAFTNSNATPGDAALSYGLYYQWGRKDPFVGPAVWDSTAPRLLYDNSGNYITHTYAASSADIGTVDYAVAHPDTFIAGAEKNDFDWLWTGHKSDLWSASSKTLYDPCPEGWRVAPSTIWVSFTATGGATSEPSEFNVDGEYRYGWTFTPDDAQPETVYYPAAGRRSFSPSLAAPSDNFTNVVNDADGVGYPVGFYWSSDYPGITVSTAMGPAPGSGSLVFRRDYVNPANIGSGTFDEVSRHTAGGFPLRCVAE